MIDVWRLGIRAMSVCLRPALSRAGFWFVVLICYGNFDLSQMPITPQHPINAHSIKAHFVKNYTPIIIPTI